ncbi:hypothetical protein SAMN04487996_111220 [Dyadobacter soli]|uniref:Uncharacterized protein n=1 Tax=Dyadobacter soli TaxID=659014 RepID=A0A1G7MBZ9_9BACT|nr:hypothetical protein [Dyadobacter soli]SDF59318.1 hypothetical protein SAMN04487996_111220 [Dyadobacter soli]
MTKKVIFFHGGGSKQDFQADQKLVDSLGLHLGPSYQIVYPFCPTRVLLTLEGGGKSVRRYPVAMMA